MLAWSTLVWTQPSSVASTQCWVLCCSFGSGCWAAPTDHFGSICVSPAHALSCRSDSLRIVYTHAFFLANLCFLSFRHIHLYVFVCVHDCFCLQLPSVLLGQSPGDTFLGRKPHKSFPRLSPAPPSLMPWQTRQVGSRPPQIGARGRREETPRPLQKLRCGSVWKWLSSTWTMLASRTRRGWDGCRLPEPEERDDDATKWPCVGVVIDQGGDGSSAWYMLDSWGCNIVGLRDPNHRIWNDCMLGSAMLGSSQCAGIPRSRKISPQ